MPRKPKQGVVERKGATTKQPAKARTTHDVKPSRKPRESYCYASSWDEGERWALHSVWNSRTHEDAMFTQGWPELFGQPDVVWFTPPMAKDYDKSAANTAAGLWGGCVNRMIRALLEQIQQGLELRDGLVVTISGAKIKLAAVEWHNLHLLEMVPLAPMPRAPWEHPEYDVWKRTTGDAPQTGDQVRPLAEEDGQGPDREEDQQEDKVSPQWQEKVGETS